MSNTQTSKANEVAPTKAKPNSALAEINCALAEGIEAANKQDGATAKLVLGFYHAFRGDELRIADARAWAKLAKTDSEKEAASKWFTNLAMDFKPYADAVTLLGNEKTGKASEIALRDKAGATIAAVKMLITRALHAVLWCVDTRKCQSLKLTPNNTLKLIGVDGDAEDNDIVSVNRAYKSAPKSQRKAMSGQGKTEADSKVTMSVKGATAFLAKELAGKHRDDLAKNNKADLQELLVQLVGIFGLDAVPRIYAAKEKGAKVA